VQTYVSNHQESNRDTGKGLYEELVFVNFFFFNLHPVGLGEPTCALVGFGEPTSAMVGIGEPTSHLVGFGEPTCASWLAQPTKMYRGWHNQQANKNIFAKEYQRLHIDTA
jgi:hypothetical protein